MNKFQINTLKENGIERWYKMDIKNQLRRDYPSREISGHVFIVVFLELAKWFILYMYQRIYCSRAISKSKKFFKQKSSFNIVVFGNGPSVNKIEKEDILEFQKRGNKIICINNFYKSAEMKTIVPNFYLLSDPAHRPGEVESKSIWEYLEEKNEEVIVIIPINWYRYAEKNISWYEKIVYFNDNSLENLSKNINPLKSRGYVSMTAYKALSVALSITTKKVAFIGLDNNYFKYIKIDKFNKLWINTGNHFYDNESQYVYSSNHFPMGYSQFIKNLYLQVRSLGNFPKDRIYNLDKDSLTDNFEKIELEEFV